MLTPICLYDQKRRAVREDRGRISCHCAATHARQMLLSQELRRTLEDSPGACVLNLEDLNCKIDAEHWFRTAKWDLIYSSELLSSLPKVAARQVMKTAAAALKPAGRLLFANAAQDSGFPICRICEMNKVYRTELEMAELTRQIPEKAIGGQTLFYDEARFNLYLELHRKTA